LVQSILVVCPRRGIAVVGGQGKVLGDLLVDDHFHALGLLLLIEQFAVGHRGTDQDKHDDEPQDNLGEGSSAIHTFQAVLVADVVLLDAVLHQLAVGVDVLLGQRLRSHHVLLRADVRSVLQ